MGNCRSPALHRPHIRRRVRIDRHGTRGGRAPARLQARYLVQHAAADPERAIWVRMGLDTGEAISDPSGDLFGRHVTTAARIANLAAGRQILVSATVREVATGDHGLAFSDGEAVELKGLDGWHTIHGVHASA